MEHTGWVGHTEVGPGGLGQEQPVAGMRGHTGWLEHTVVVVRIVERIEQLERTVVGLLVALALEQRLVDHTVEHTG